MSVEILQERSVNINFTNEDIDTFASLMKKVCKKKMGFLKGELSKEEDNLANALSNYFKEEEDE